MEARSAAIRDRRSRIPQALHSPAKTGVNAIEALYFPLTEAGVDVFNPSSHQRPTLHPMDTVAFITTESGDDLIVSFAVREPVDFTGIESLTLLWTPKYDHLRPPEERGVKVSFERFMLEENEPVQEVRDSASEQIVWVAAPRRTYELDVRKVAPGELAAMRRVFGKMSRLGGLRYVRL
jgi:hypothetical protein